MKVYISADMEGVCGTTSWDDVTSGKDGYQEARHQMTAEVTAACEGALEAGATEIVVRDAHDAARNIIASELPEKITLIRGWSRHPYMMMQVLDRTFDAAFMIGYHTFAGGGGNPLAHTMNTTHNSSLLINGGLASEFLINHYTALLEGVPVVFLTGDLELCRHAREHLPSITTVAVKTGSGESTSNMHPKAALAAIKKGAKDALSAGIPKPVPLPQRFEITLNFTNHKDAFKTSFYPGAELQSPRVVGFTADDYFDVLRFFLFNL